MNHLSVFLSITYLYIHPFILYNMTLSIYQLFVYGYLEMNLRSLSCPNPIVLTWCL